MSATPRQRIGHWGEGEAARYLEGKGYQVLGRNLRTPYGEIDIAALGPAGQEQPLVFVEVKTRTGKRFGFPEAAVTARKLEHMTGAAQHYLTGHSEYDHHAWRLDVIAIQAFEDGRVEITHFENITG